MSVSHKTAASNKGNNENESDVHISSAISTDTQLEVAAFGINEVNARASTKLMHVGTGYNWDR